MALRFAAGAISNLFSRTRPAAVCSAIPSLQVQPNRGKQQRKLNSKRKHQEKIDIVYVPYRPSIHPTEKIKNLYSGEAGVPVLAIGETGSVFDTQIKRRTTIRDPNRPIGQLLGPQKECLKWTDWRMNRDVVRRLVAAEFHPTRKNLICVKKAHQLPEELRNKAFDEIANKIPLHCAPGHLTNRCVISSRARGKFYMFRMSRITWRLLADYNKLSGVKKSTWGP